MKSKHSTIPVTLALVFSSLVMLTPGVAAHHDGDSIDDDTEAILCGLFVLQALGFCTGSDLDAASTPDPEDLPIPDDPTDPGELPGPEDLIPEDLPIPEDLIPEDLIPEDVPSPEDLPGPDELVPEDAADGALGTPMSTVVGPVCEASDNEPGEICILQFFTLGQALCFVRAQAPAGGAVLLCTAGQILVHCSGSDAVAMLDYVASDLDCDGHSNQYEADQGCDPVDPLSYPVGPSECAGGGGQTVSPVGCGETDPGFLLGNLLFDTDCDGHSTEYEVSQGCNPADAAEHPDVAGGCSFGALPDAGSVPEVPEGPSIPDLPEP